MEHPCWEFGGVDENFKGTCVALIIPVHGVYQICCGHMHAKMVGKNMSIP
jgi:hypothetical protein